MRISQISLMSVPDQSYNLYIMIPRDIAATLKTHDR